MATSLAPASASERFVNSLIDVILSFVISITLSFTVLLKQESIAGKAHAWQGASFVVAGLSVYFLGQFVYYFLSELLWERTFGKSLTSTQVIARSGGKLSVGKLVIRTIVRVIPFDALPLLFKSRRTLHDIASGSLVVLTKDLPPTRQHTGKTLRNATVVLLVAPIALLFFIWPIYESLTGGERIELPANMPHNLRIVEYKEVQSKDDHAYYVMRFEGDGVSIDMNRMIAGFDFDPDVHCSYMAPSHSEGFGYDPISSSLTCTQLSPRDQYISAWKVSSNSTDPTLVQNTPDYYVHKPPFRYPIKVTKGTLNDQDVKNMASGEFKTYTARQLRDLSSQGAIGHLSLTDSLRSGLHSL